MHSIAVSPARRHPSKQYRGTMENPPSLTMWPECSTMLAPQMCIRDSVHVGHRISADHGHAELGDGARQLVVDQVVVLVRPACEHDGEGAFTFHLVANALALDVYKRQPVPRGNFECANRPHRD